MANGQGAYIVYRTVSSIPSSAKLKHVTGKQNHQGTSDCCGENLEASSSDDTDRGINCPQGRRRERT